MRRAIALQHVIQQGSDRDRRRRSAAKFIMLLGTTRLLRQLLAEREVPAILFRIVGLQTHCEKRPTVASPERLSIILLGRLRFPTQITFTTLRLGCRIFSTRSRMMQANLH